MQRRRASRDGPVAVATARPHRELLEAAGFSQVTERDCTATFAAVTRAWIQQWEANHEDLVTLLGEPAVERRQAERRAQLRAIEDGILSRSLLTACRPRRDRTICPPAQQLVMDRAACASRGGEGIPGTRTGHPRC
jgi:hypothetical protein